MGWISVNVIVDPFGVFGTSLLAWDSYSMTLNSKNGKTVYLSRHFDAYDSYIIGSPAAEAYLPETLRTHWGGSFYNLFHREADLAYDEALVSWLLQRDDVKRILLVLSLEDAASAGTAGTSITECADYRIDGTNPLFYYGKFAFADIRYAREKLFSRRNDTEMPQDFDCFLPESGCYDRRIRDAESIGALEDYLEADSSCFSDSPAASSLAYIDQCAAHVSDIRSMCEAAGTELLVVLSPAYRTQLEAIPEEQLYLYYEKLAEAAPYWNFAASPVSYEPRYFYDATHLRNAAGDMVLAKIFDAERTYYPADFGTYCSPTEKNAPPVRSAPDTQSITVPVLLYHNILENGDSGRNDNNIPLDDFIHQMDLLRRSGRQTISFDDLIAYVYEGAPLPEHPVIITFDDGYRSNYTLAYPVLKARGFHGTIFTIGCSIGHTRYKDTQYSMTPHFGAAEMADMTASNLITIASHTYDMHQWAPFESGDAVRESILPLAGETEAHYIAALKQDVALQQKAFQSAGLEPCRILAFPKGLHSPLTDVTLRECGYLATVTTDNTRENTVTRGLPQSLIALGRMTLSQSITDEEILEYLSR